MEQFIILVQFRNCPFLMSVDKGVGLNPMVFMANFIDKATDRYWKKSFHIGVFVLLLNLFISLVPPSSAEALPSILLTKYDIRNGVFLVATSSLLDPSFRETVVLICDHGEEGTIGLIVNRPTNFPLSDVFPDIPGLKGFSVPLYEGGPVQRQGILMLFRSVIGSENTKSVLDGVFWGGDREMIASIVEAPNPESQFRIFSGYAGWSQRQLETEIEGRFWTTVPASAEIIFDHDPATLWEELNERSTHPRLLVSYPPSPRVYDKNASMRFFQGINSFFQPAATHRIFLNTHYISHSR